VARDFLYMMRKAGERHDDDLALAFLERRQAVNGLLEDLQDVPIIHEYRSCIKQGKDFVIDLRR